MADSVDTSPHATGSTSIAVDLRARVDHAALAEAIAAHAPVCASSGVDSVLVDVVSRDHAVIVLTHRHADPLGPLPAIAAAYAATRSAGPDVRTTATDHIDTASPLTSYLPIDTASAALSASTSRALRLKAGRDDVDLADVIAAACIESGRAARVEVLDGVGPVSFGDLCGEVAVLRRDTPGEDAPVVRVYRTRDDRLRLDLVDATADPHRGVDRLLAVLTSPAAASVPTSWDDIDELTVPATVVDLVDLALARDPDAVAIEFTRGGKSISYGELDSRVNQVTRGLVAHGVGTDVVVGVMCADPVWATVATLAVYRAGGGVLPLPVSGAPTLLSGLIDAADPACVVTDRLLTDDDIDPDAVMGEFVRDADVSDILGAAGPRPVADAHDPAASTLFEQDHDVTSLARTGFDVIPPWVTVIALDPLEIADHSDDPICPSELHGPARLGSTALVAWVASGNAAPVVISHSSLAARLQWTVSQDGEVVTDLPDTRHLDADWITTVLLPLTTSATLRADGQSARRGTAPDRSARRRVSPTHTLTRLAEGCGAMPAWNTEMYVLDDRLQPLPPGAVGELYIAGAHLPRGHAGRSASTSSRFVANPFRPGERMLATDIRVRRDADGSLAEVESGAVVHPTVMAPESLRRFDRMGPAGRLS
ncbi:AMP-binding protein [Williamsia sp. MIQD14]|uniref:AMP-binding protein n=1 Tax=Williamsia sp. MIQD14 TaxID=3425703 RepID=UPI003DA13300